ncbi:hypothetical protein AGR9A_Cc210769 [Agrobacterium salinitolerans str. Hayward 0363]|nr:hypothetical protein AGR9A_Cc210769 [Agrobacterium salinitolerans str. Hayward 0363]
MRGCSRAPIWARGSFFCTCSTVCGLSDGRRVDWYAGLKRDWHDDRNTADAVSTEQAATILPERRSPEREKNLHCAVMLFLILYARP